MAVTASFLYSPWPRSTHLPNSSMIAENLALFSSLNLSNWQQHHHQPLHQPFLLTRASSSSSSSSSSAAAAAAAVASKAEPPSQAAPKRPRRAFIPLLVQDADGNLSLKLPNNVTVSDDAARLEDIAPLQPHNQKKQNAASPPFIRPSQGPAHSKKTVSAAPRYSKAARRFYNETFRQPERLGKVLAAAGVASRRGSEDVIFEGRVTVNGNVCKLPQTLVDPLKDSIYIDGRSLPKKLAPKLYFALNKPKGYICSSSDKEEKSVLSLLDDYMRIWVQRNPGLPKPRLFTVGRLDVATTGLIFVTNDGNFAFNVSHPSSGLTKEYIATVDNKVSKRQIQVIAGGTLVQGVRCIPDMVELIDVEKDDVKSRLRIVVSEGRNHEVRQLVENAGLEVNALKRVRIGGYRLPRTLGIGKHLLLTEANLKKAQLIKDAE